MSTRNKIRVVLTILTCMSLERVAYAEQYAPEDLTVEGITCTGNVRVSCDEIKEAVSQKINQKVDEQQIKNSKIRLGVTGKFESVETQLKKGSAPGKAILEVAVKESSSLFGGVSSGFVLYGSKAHGVVDTTMGTRDFLGKGKTLQGSVRVLPGFYSNAEFQGATRLDYIDPRLLDNPKYYLLSTIGISRYQISVPNTSAQTFGIGNVEVGRRVFNFSAFYTGVFLYANESVNTVLYGGYSYNNEDHPNFPRTGQNLRVSLGYKAGFKESNYVYADFGYRKNWSILSRSVLTLNLLSNGFMSLADRFYSFPLESEHPVISLRYSYDFGRNKSSNEGGFFRAYIEPGFGAYLDTGSYAPETKGYATNMGLKPTPLVKAGVAFENSIFGTVNLFVVYGTEGPR